MKIALIELNFHYDSLDSLCRLFNNNTNELHVFTTRSIYNKLSAIKNSNAIKFYIQKSTRVRFIRTHIEILNSCNFIFINTISRDFRLFGKIKFTTTTIARIHNIHKTFDPYHHLYISLKPIRIWKTTSYILREMLIGGFLFYRKRALNSIDYFSFPDMAMQNYALEKKYVVATKIAPIIPIKFYTESYLKHIPETKQNLNLAIIGNIDFRRKNYEDIIEAFSKLTNDKQITIQAYFLGNASGRDGGTLQIKFEKIKNNNLEVIFYNQYIELEEFKKRIQEADLIISPVKTNALVEIFNEIYGKSKTTGSISDMITFGKPMIISDITNETDPLFKYIDTYTDAPSLISILEKYSKDLALVENKQMDLIQFVSDYYSKEVIFTTFSTFLDTFSNFGNKA